jgi:hypothetical protein
MMNQSINQSTMMKKRFGSCALCGFNNNECNVVVSPTPNLSINDNDPRRRTKISMQVANNRILHTVVHTDSTRQQKHLWPTKAKAYGAQRLSPPRRRQSGGKFDSSTGTLAMI